MPILHEVAGVAKAKIYCPATICWTCVHAVLQTITVGLTKVGNQAKPLYYSVEMLYFVPI
jgi:hypothetical protein